MSQRLYSPMEMEELRSQYREKISRIRSEVFTPADMEILQEIRTDDEWFW